MKREEPKERDSTRLTGLPAQAREFFARQLRTYPLPAFLIVGAQKAGTTSLASYLAAHPNVVSPSFKEVHFFDLNYLKGESWYRLHFPIGARRWIGAFCQGRRLRAIDATPYYLLHPETPRRVSCMMPDVKIIILLRDPVYRAYSHYHHEVRLGTEHLSFEEAIEAEEARTAGERERLSAHPSYPGFNYQHFSYLQRGVYAEQICRWLQYFRREQFLILSSEVFFKNPGAAYRRVLKFLGFPDWEPAAYRAEHVGKYPALSSDTRDRLTAYYAMHNRTLREALNLNWPGTGDEIVEQFSA